MSSNQLQFDFDAPITPVMDHSPEETSEPIQTSKNCSSGFSFELKKRRSLGADICIFSLVTLAVWGITQVGLNFPAYAEIAQYKINQLTSSVVSAIDTPEEVAPAPVEKVRTPFRNKQIKPNNNAQETFAKMFVYPSDNRLVLPRLGKNVPLITVSTNKNWSQLEKNIQKGLQEGVVVHPVSHAPGNFGNLFLTGHSSYYAWDNGRFKDVFALLHELKEGDMAEVYWEGKRYEYRLRKSEIVPPTEVSILNQPTDRSIITLMTCTPVGTNKNRLIWVGDLVKDPVEQHVAVVQ